MDCPDQAALVELSYRRRAQALTAVAYDGPSLAAEFVAQRRGGLLNDLAAFNHHPIVDSRGAHTHLAVEHIGEHGLRRPFERVAIASAACSPHVEHVARMHRELKLRRDQ